MVLPSQLCFSLMALHVPLGAGDGGAGVGGRVSVHGLPCVHATKSPVPTTLENARAAVPARNHHPRIGPLDSIKDVCAARELVLIDLR